MIYPIGNNMETVIEYIPKIKREGHFLYLFILLGFLILIATLPFISLDISVKANGICRPTSERTEIKTLISGIIDSLYIKDGEYVKKGEVILRLKDLVTKSKIKLNKFEIEQRLLFIHDLEILTTTNDSLLIVSNLFSSLYKDQAFRFLHRINDLDASVKKANKEIEMNLSLYNDKVISPKEFFDIQINQDKSLSSYKAYKQEQLSIWEQELIKYKIEINQFQQQEQQMKSDATFFEVKAPISGFIQGLNTRYADGMLQSNEILGTISPEVTIMGECYVASKDIGLLTKGQFAKYKFEAFDYNYFGILTGKILSIDNDVSIIDNKPVYKIRCSFDKNELSLKNGFSVKLKKGVGFQASFIVTRRTLWQLIFDKLNNWLNPNSPHI